MELDTRVALLESEMKQRHREMMEFRDMMKGMNANIVQLLNWQASMRYPVSAVGFLLVGLLTAAGYGIWNFVRDLSS